MLNNWGLTFDKEKYLLHYENLQLYLRLGLKLKQMHLILEFNLSQWLKLLVEFNKQKRTEAEKWRQRWKSIVQIIELCHIRENNRKLEK